MILANGIDITGTGAQVPLSASLLKGKWVQLLADPANGSAVIHVGGSTTSATVGLPLAAGAGQFCPPVSDQFEFYQLQLMFAYIPNGAVLHVLYAVEGSQS